MKIFCVFLILFFTVTVVFSQEAETEAETSENTGETVPDDGTGSVEDQSVNETEETVGSTETGGEQTETEQPAQSRRRRPRRRLQLLDVHDPSFTDARIPDYTVPDEKNQILADVDEPELQTESDESKAESDSDKEESGKNETLRESGVIERTVNSMDYSIRNLIAWGSLIALLVLMIVLYRIRTGKRRRRVFRKIPSKRR